MKSLTTIFVSNDIVGKTVDLVNNNYQPYTPAQYLYNEILNKEITAKNLEAAIELIYATLCSWNMNQRGAKLAPYKDFKNSSFLLWPQIESLKNVHITDMNNESKINLKELFIKAKVTSSEKKSILVTNSKFLHFFLPNLVIPIDRTYTMKFYKTSIPSTFEKQAELFINIQNDASNFSKAYNLNGYLNDKMNRNIPKLIDNLIISHIRSNIKSIRKT
jgi:hypothetical protein